MDKNNRKMAWLIRILLVIGMAVLVLIIIAVGKETNKKNQVQAEIDKLREEAEKIEKDNSQLTDKLAYFESQDFQEKEAKDKLNLQNPEEKVVIIKPSLAKEAKNNSDSQPDRVEVKIKMSNVQKWWDYFFDYSQ